MICRTTSKPGLSLLPHQVGLRWQFQSPQAIGLLGSEGAVSCGEDVYIPPASPPSRYRGAAGAGQEGLVGMAPGLKVGALVETELEGRGMRGQAGIKLLASESTLNLLSRSDLGPDVMHWGKVVCTSCRSHQQG